MVNKNGGTLVCGLSGEVHNNLYMSNDRFDDNEERYHRYSFKLTTWTMLTLTAPDQLRQRMAWALNQIIPIAPGIMFDRYESQAAMQFYDIFVRNAFGNYRDILREVAYNSQMGDFLIYKANEAIDIQWFESGKIKYEFGSFKTFTMFLCNMNLYLLLLMIFNFY